LKRIMVSVMELELDLAVCLCDDREI